MSILRNIENELVATPLQKSKNYIRSDEYADTDSLKILSDAILQFKEENLLNYKSEKILDILILKQVFAFLIEKQGIDSKTQKNTFDILDVNGELKKEHVEKIEYILSNFNIVSSSDDVLGHIYQSIQSQENQKRCWTILHTKQSS